MYISVGTKLTVSLIIAAFVTTFIFYINAGWAAELSEYFHPVVSWAIVLGISVIPGFTIALIYSLLIMDRRPEYDIPEELPDVTILIAAYNEEKGITTTLESIAKQEYPGKVHTIIIDDGSTDGTVAAVQAFRSSSSAYDRDKFEFRLMAEEENCGKSCALNKGLEETETKYVITLDADTYLFKDALAHLVTNIHLGPDNTAAVAGNILVRNSRVNLMTKMQEWEYFLSIAASKRAQSLLQGTLVAQGAISVYDTKAVREEGGWNPNAIGEDIVLTWGLQQKGYRCAYCEKAIAFTDVPTTYRKFFRQRERWARGMIEAFKTYPGVIFRLNYTSPFIWVNLLLPLVDFVFLTAFLPGLIAAVFFGWYEIVSIMTLIVIPLIVVLVTFMLLQHRGIFKKQELKIRKNWLGLIFFSFTYMAIMCPATVLGYIKELLNLDKNWGTKK